MSNGKNLIVRNASGRVVDYKPNQGKNAAEMEKKFKAEFLGFDDYRWEATDDCYTQKWGKWWVCECGCDKRTSSKDEGQDNGSAAATEIK